VIKKRLTPSQKQHARSVAGALVRPVSPLLGLPILAAAYGADKPAHYIRLYSDHFRRLRHRRLRILEIGIGGYDDPRAGGESLRMWASFFWRSQVYGLDITDKSAHDRPRIKTVVGDQNDPTFLRQLGEKYGPFDIIVDDGSHVSQHIITSIRTLFEAHLRDGGFYVVEDLHTSYWPQFDGLTDTTSVDFLKGFADATNAQFILHGDTPFGGLVASITFHPEIAFVRKGVTGRVLPEFMRHEMRVAADRIATAPRSTSQ
jgi:hypothetical protein